jgi:hypothetical protein
METSKEMSSYAQLFYETSDTQHVSLSVMCLTGVVDLMNCSDPRHATRETTMKLQCYKPSVTSDRPASRLCRPFGRLSHRSRSMGSRTRHCVFRMADSTFERQVRCDHRHSAESLVTRYEQKMSEIRASRRVDRARERRVSVCSENGTREIEVHKFSLSESRQAGRCSTALRGNRRRSEGRHCAAAGQGHWRDYW